MTSTFDFRLHVRNTKGCLHAVYVNYLHPLIYAHAYGRTHIYSHTHTHMHAYTRARARTHTHTHTHTHTNTHTLPADATSAVDTLTNTRSALLVICYCVRCRYVTHVPLDGWWMIFGRLAVASQPFQARVGKQTPHV